jgi:DNA polymerase III delta subunit
MLEIDKIKTLMDVRKCDCTTAYLTLINEGQIYKTPQALIFDLSDAVLLRDEKLAFNVLNTLKQLKTNHVLMLSIIYLNMRNMLIYQASKAQGISSGLNGYIAKCLSDKAGRYSTGEIIENLRIIQQAELDLKRGKVDPDFVVEFILLQVL